MPDLQQRIADILQCHRFDDSSHFAEIFCHEREDSPMVGMKRGSGAQADWQEWVDHASGVLAFELGLTEEWGVKLQHQPVQVKQCKEHARERAQRIVTSFWKRHQNVAGAILAEPQPEVVSRYVTEWETA